MNNTTEINQGELIVKFNEPLTGKITLKDLGFSDDDLFFDGGMARIVFDLEGIGEHHYFQMPTVEFKYKENVNESYWNCEFNETKILDKTDHHGHTSILLLNRKQISELEHHHQNKLIIHAEFSEPVHLNADESYINLFK